MAQEHVDEMEAKPPDAPPTDIQRPAELQRLTVPSAYDILMKQHRDAILRIHTLETENQNLMNLLKQTLSGNAFTFKDQAANPSELLARIQALEGRAEPQQAASQPDPSGPADLTETQRISRNEIEQLRVQNQTLVGQVSRLDTQLEEIRSERVQRRRKSSRDRKKGLLQRLFGRRFDTPDRHRK